MAFLQDDIVLAFIEHTQTVRGGGSVGFSKRSGPGGSYVNVFGPSQHRSNARNSRVAIDPNGSVGLKDAAVATVLQATRRARGAVFQGTGAAHWSLSRAQCATIYVTESDLVRAIVSALTQHSSW